MWVMSAGRDPAVAAAHVRFAPKATGLLRHREWTRRATSGCEQSQQSSPHSITERGATGRPELHGRSLLQVDDQLELGWLFDREIGGFCAAQPKPDSCAIPVR